MRSSARPNQLTRMPIFIVGWAITAGVHSIVWIFACRAPQIRRARWKSSSSSYAGYAALSASQIALCSISKISPSMCIPSQKPGSRFGSPSGFSPLCGGRVSDPTWSFPSVPVRARIWCSSVVP